MSDGDVVPPPAVLAAFGPTAAAATWTCRRGGFSGAVVFAGSATSAAEPRLCLKAWPADAMSPERLAHIHRWVAKAVVHSFVPRVHRSVTGRTWTDAGRRLWELTTWMPGVAETSDRTSDTRLSNACRAIAALHVTWRPTDPTNRPFPAVERRRTLLQEYQQARPRRDRLVGVTARAAIALKTYAVSAEQQLAPWLGRVSAVQPCLCDVHRDHVLFTGNAVTGIIDYGAMKLDHPAVDLARLLGDLVGDDPDRVRLGLKAYHAAGGSEEVTAELVRLLDRTGTVCAVANWLLRLSHGPPADPAAVAVRLERLVGRLEQGFAP